MIRCQSCGTGNFDTSQFCDQCGARLRPTPNGAAAPEYRPPPSNPSIRGAQVTSVGIPPIVEPVKDAVLKHLEEDDQHGKIGHAHLEIERGHAANTQFQLFSDESNIGRWDADNGIFPDVDLDAFDPDAKVSRRHARIVIKENVYMIEDLGSTNGTFVNRGRRLLPGVPQVLSDGDEIIVGKTFLRFHING